MKYKMTIAVPVKSISTIMEVLSDEGILVSIEPFTNHHPTRTRLNRGSGGKSKWELDTQPRGSQIEVVKAMQGHGGVLHVKVLKALLSDMAEGTISSCLSYLQKKGYTTNVGRAEWRLTPQGEAWKQ